MQNTDVLIKKKSRPNPLPGQERQETLKSLVSMVVCMSRNKKAASQSRALQTGQEITKCVISVLWGYSSWETKPCIAALSQLHGTSILLWVGMNFSDTFFHTACWPSNGLAETCIVSHTFTTLLSWKQTLIRNKVPCSFSCEPSPPQSLGKILNLCLPTY